MPTTFSKLIRGAMKSLKPIVVNLSLEMERAGTDFLAKGENRRLPAGMNVMRLDVEDIPAEWFLPEGAPHDAAVIYFHGGAYMTGTLMSSRVLAVDFAQATGLNTLSFEYRLAPEHPYPAALEDAYKIYLAAVEWGVPPEGMVFAGDSAGGGLLCALALLLRDKGLALPGGMVMLSPWVDLTMSGESHTLYEDIDPLLTRAKLERAVEYYTGHRDLKNPYISPVFGDFKGFPPALIHVGTNELLLSESQALCEAMRACGVSVTLEEWEGMWHVWHVFDIPETREAMGRIGAFVRGICVNGRR